jgi:hypothetical protein
MISFLVSALECKHHATKAETEVEAELHAFLTLALDDVV